MLRVAANGEMLRGQADINSFRIWIYRCDILDVTKSKIEKAPHFVTSVTPLRKSRQIAPGDPEQILF
jgi:hypothetical protein